MPRRRFRSVPRIAIAAVLFALSAAPAAATTGPTPIRAAPCDRSGCGPRQVIGYAGPGRYDLLATRRLQDGRRLALMRGGRASWMQWRISIDRRRWGPVHAFGEDGWTPRLALAPDGSVVAAWFTIGRVEQTGLRVALLRAGRMGRPRTLAPCDADLRFARDPDGPLLVACRSGGSDSEQGYGSGRARLGEWPAGARSFGSLEPYDDAGPQARDLQLVARAGRLVFAWAAADVPPPNFIATGKVVRVAIRERGSWGLPVTLGPSRIDGPVRAELDAGGTARVRWYTDAPYTLGHGYTRAVVSAPPGMTFGAPVVSTER